MSHGNLAPYKRRFFGRDDNYATGSLLFDLHRNMRRMLGRKDPVPHKTRLFPGI